MLGRREKCAGWSKCEAPFTPAALEEASMYLDTAMMETMK